MPDWLWLFTCTATPIKYRQWQTHFKVLLKHAHCWKCLKSIVSIPLRSASNTILVIRIRLLCLPQAKPVHNFAEKQQLQPSLHATYFGYCEIMQNMIQFLSSPYSQIDLYAIMQRECSYMILLSWYTTENTTHGLLTSCSFSFDGSDMPVCNVELFLVQWSNSSDMPSLTPALTNRNLSAEARSP